MTTTKIHHNELDFMESDKNIVKLLWTGGWDSTFRLCELLLVHRVKVQPYYLIDPDRKSTREEVIAQKRIRAALIDLDPEIEKLLYPIKAFVASDFPLDENLRKSFIELSKLCPFGSQYEWLANFTLANSIDTLELSAEKVEGHIRYIFLNKYMDQVLTAKTLKNYRLNGQKSPKSVMAIFGSFLFPLHDRTREDMHAISVKYKFLYILEKTWFCHTPINGRPCGWCHPCIDVVNYGYKYRLGLMARIRFHFRSFTKTAMIEKNPKLIHMIKHIFSIEKQL